MSNMIYTTITRILEFDAGHRVLGHEGKCNSYHGHRYKVELCVTAPKLDKLGRLIDFGVLKSVFGKWIDENLDHAMILKADDPMARLYVLTKKANAKTGFKLKGEIHELFGGPQKPFVMDANPTAENIGALLLQKATEMLVDHGINVVSIRLWETPNCWADCFNMVIVPKN